ncbi:hypothetical protein BDU57DRAFT_540375 [Ampelomyces quisqualis]|uniref:Uncharacterized protein n=1 Tax=Ampelomyces quisqualis TaxID=50730 RepID=A0A6A5QK57_AMPQU|nr:hypothetical protein BDU57DRAFT_540375 [Ampelomyces quisqualis]
MDCLPLELSAIVFEHLIEYDLAPKSFSEYTEEPTDRLTRWTRAEPSLNWELLTQDSRSWILNTRISSRKMYHTSHAAFAKLLGDRKFRYTRVGMDDMAGIGQNPDLAPHITTLANGCGGFYWPGDVSAIKKHLSALKHAEQERL